MMNFPADTFVETTTPDALAQSLNVQPQKAYKGKTDYLLVYANESEIREHSLLTLAL